MSASPPLWERVSPLPWIQVGGLYFALLGLMAAVAGDRRCRGAFIHPVIDPTGIAVPLLVVGQSQTPEVETEYPIGIAHLSKS